MVDETPQKKAGPLTTDDLLSSDEDAEDVMRLKLIQDLLGTSTSAVGGISPTASGIISRSTSSSSLKKSRRHRSPTPTRTVSFIGLDSNSVASSIEDLKEQHELLEKIGRLKDILKQAEIDLSAEKAMRKKKERNVVKLAKELNKRAKDQAVKETKIESLLQRNADLEAKLNAARSEIETRRDSGERKAREYNDELNIAHQKYRGAVAEHDIRIVEMTKEHTAEVDRLNRQHKDLLIEVERLRTQIQDTKRNLMTKDAERDELELEYKAQIANIKKVMNTGNANHERRVSEILQRHLQQSDELRKQVMEANLECDQIKSQMAGLEMKQSPRNARVIKERTLASFATANQDKEKISPAKIILLLCAAALVSLLGGGLWMERQGLLTFDSLCAPVKPRTNMSQLAVNDATTHVAPWWSPQSTKDTAFKYVCDGRRERTILEWMPNTQVMLVKNAATSSIVVEKRYAQEVTIKANVIETTNKRGKVDVVEAPWAVQR